MKTLLTFLPHMAAFDACFPLVERLAHRGRIRCETVVGPRIRQTEPRVADLLERADIGAEQVSLAALEVFSLGRIMRADAILTHSDPIAYGKKTRLRDVYTRGTGRRVAMVQHGMFQGGLNYTLGGRRWRYHSELLLLWRDLDARQRAEIFDGPVPRIVETGLIKTNRLPLRAPDADLAARIAAARQVVLIAHNYGHEEANYDTRARDRAFATWARVFDARPDTLFILRGHRGRRHAEVGPAVAKLISGRANVLLSDRHEGALRFSTINDVLAFSDRVLTHPSTVVLDALGAGVPVGVLDNNRAELEPLAQITDGAAFEAFLDAEDPLGPAAPLLAAYGDIERNLDRAAEALETWIAQG
ncbi:hypothetical protein [Profundibacterium mesophilum]|uniref:Glycosyltransferase n=1 Tax=Profundibacterium mesophilum KAUST100406-0324 TaxID=1037889 RepID=A0A921NTD1_9RHOB|nr:hypothetical protein [Profundibacterium mesophilum]KAF0675175.1 hypothetical protein PMES_02438 [Profundibacterium mesophilum KAUST100406-0324]